jgi:tetratricopeptide (TPR) repeat protein
LDGDASTNEIRNAYIKLTAHKKFSKALTEDPQLRAEFISIYQAYVTLMKHRSETDLVNNSALYPQDQIFQLQFNQGVYLVLTQQWIKAGEKFQAAYILNKNHSLLQTYLGLILLKRKNEYAAEKYLLRAIDINPSNAEAWLFLGDVYLHTGNLKKAKTMYQSALDLSGNNISIQKRMQLIKQKELNPETSQGNLVGKIKKLFG